MQKRVGLARAIIKEPKVLILDEPTTGLDPIIARQINKLIKELVKKKKSQQSQLPMIWKVFMNLEIT